MPTRFELVVAQRLLAVIARWERLRLRLPLRQAPSPMPWQRTHLTVAAAQWRLDPVTRFPSWVDQLVDYFEEAHRRSVALLVFPEDMAIPLLGLVSGRIRVTHGQALSSGETGQWLYALAPRVERLYVDVFSRLSRAYGMTVVAGSALTLTRSRLFNRALVFGPDGTLLVAQAKLHLLPLERDWGICPGTRLEEQPVGPLPLFTAVCHDASFFETYRMAEHAGAEIMAIPIADPDVDYQDSKARRGAWARTQETGLPSIVGAATGELYGIRLTGKAAVYVPLALTDDGGGIVAQSASPDGEGLVSATLNLNQLAAFRRELVPQAREELVARWLAPRYDRMRESSPT